MHRVSWLPVVMTVALLAGATQATDLAIPGVKLVVVDRTATAGTAKVVFIAKDPAITKGTGTDQFQIDAVLDVAYDSVSGAFTMPQGSGWVANTPAVAKYVNTSAPVGGSVKVGVIKPGKLVRVVAKSLGTLDVRAAPQGTVYVAYTVENGAETIRHCTQFTACMHEAIAAGTGHKLVCRGNSTGDPSCTATGFFPTCPGPVDTDCGGCPFGCVTQHATGTFVCVDSTQCDVTSTGCTVTTDCAVPGQECIDIPPIAGGTGTICCSPCAP